MNESGSPSQSAEPSAPVGEEPEITVDAPAQPSLTEADASHVVSVLFRPRTAVLLSGSVLAGFFAITIIAAWQKPRVFADESWVEMTGVGDMQYVASEKAMAGMDVFSFKSGPVTLAGAKPVNLRDTRMRRVAADDSGTYQIYKVGKPRRNEPEIQGYFVKQSPGRYWPVTAPMLADLEKE